LSRLAFYLHYLPTLYFPFRPLGATVSNVFALSPVIGKEQGADNWATTSMPLLCSAARFGGFPPCLRFHLLSSTKTGVANEIQIHTGLLPQTADRFHRTSDLSFHTIFRSLVEAAFSLPLLAAARIVPTNSPQLPCAISHGP